MQETLGRQEEKAGDYNSYSHYIVTGEAIHHVGRSPILAQLPQNEGWKSGSAGAFEEGGPTRPRPVMTGRPRQEFQPPSRRRDCHSTGPSSPFSRRFNRG